MADYDLFWLQLSPDIHGAPSWTAQVIQSPIPAVHGPQKINPSFTLADLKALRSNIWPNQTQLEQIGQRAWESIANPIIEAHFVMCLQQSQQAGKRLRLVVSLLGDMPANGGIRISELPVEVIFQNQQKFIASDITTPVSRSLQAAATKDPAPIILPLKVLVAIASPQDRAPTNSTAEENAIRKALLPLGNYISLTVCRDVTRAKLFDYVMNDEKYDVFHFIGHGGVDQVAGSTDEKGYICFIDGNNNTDPVDGDQLATLIRATEIKLVVLSACCTSAAPAASDAFGANAFDSVAHSLMLPFTGPTGVVAMQFDWENKAAVEFTTGFYSELLRPGTALDEAVTKARVRVSFALPGWSGHRAWVTPTLYWRCKNGIVFDIAPMIKNSDQPDIKALEAVELKLSDRTNQLAFLVRQPAVQRALLADREKSLDDEIKVLELERSKILGDSVRIWGGIATTGSDQECPILLRLRSAGTITSVSLSVKYSTTELDFLKVVPGKDTGTGAALRDDGTGQATMLWDDVSGGLRFEVGEYEIGKIKYRTRTPNDTGMIELRVEKASVTRDGKQVDVGGLGAVIFSS